MKIDKFVTDEFADAVERLCESLGCTEKGLPQALGITEQAISNAKRKPTIPKTWAKRAQDQHGINSEWILTGNGEKTMREFHQQLANEIQTVNEMLFDVLKKVERYGVTSKETKQVNKMRQPYVELKHLLDERAFKECMDLPESKRSDIYYEWAKRIPLATDAEQVTSPEPVTARPIPEATPGILATGRTIPLIGLAECGVEGWSTQMEGMAATTQVPDVHEDMIAALAIGDSMEPAGIKPGNVIFADPRLTPNPGDIVYVVRRDGRGEGTATVKIYQGETDGWLELCGWLPKKHSENGQKKFCIKEKLEYVEVVAPVVMIRKRAE
ncbi:MAG TPA: hypothetical protein DCS48_07495 [Desulfovibrio sp.]|nr:hypothetical protein [Desulfovibrio sp.]